MNVPKAAVFNPEYQNDYAVFKCTKCKAMIYGLMFGHTRDCPAPNYGSTILYFGPNCLPFIEKAKEQKLRTWNGISIKTLLKKAKEKK